MTLNKFAVFILTNGRPNNVITYKTLKKCGYTGKIYLICDNEDKTLPEYKKLYGDAVIVFDKDKYLKLSDRFTTKDIRNIVLSARNACHDIAKDLGLTHFLELDDDYDQFIYRAPKDGKLPNKNVKNLDEDIREILTFLDVSGAHAVCLAQNGDYIGGANGTFAYKGLTRKAMNCYFCRTDRPFKFMGFINEDTNAYTLLGNRGYLFFTICNLAIHQTETQKAKGGLTEIYLDVGTYVKSFLSVICSPNAVKISSIRSVDNGERIHHRVNWNNCAPKILNSKWKKV